MSEFEQLFPKEFHASPGVEDWRVLPTSTSGRRASRSARAHGLTER